MDHSDSHALRTPAVAAALALLAACGSSTDSQIGAERSSKVGSPTRVPSGPAPVTTLRAFPAFPRGALPGPVAAKLQAALDAALRGGSVRGATAGVIVAGGRELVGGCRR
jgi:hypothetical protein